MEAQSWSVSSDNTLETLHEHFRAARGDLNSTGKSCLLVFLCWMGAVGASCEGPRRGGGSFRAELCARLLRYLSK